jgi:hypothetical protein
MPMSDADVLELERTPSVAFPEARVGWLVVGSTPEALFVDFPGNPGGPAPARATFALDADAVEQAVATRRGAVLMFERGRADLPIVVGLLQAEAVELELEVDGPADTPADSSSDGHAEPAPQVASPAVRVDADGKRLELEAHDEIVLRCGPASITLRRNGRVVIRGVYVESRASGRNRIKGGTVQIN